jgi:hypothetical protein
LSNQTGDTRVFAKAKTNAQPSLLSKVNYESIVNYYIEQFERKEVLRNPSQIEYQFKPEITKIFGKGGTLER